MVEGGPESIVELFFFNARGEISSVKLTILIGAVLAIFSACLSGGS